MTAPEKLASSSTQAVRASGGIAVVGSVNMDLVVRLPRHPRPGETLMGSDYTMNPGGKGANQAVAAARLGASGSFVGRVGSDEFGHRLAGALEEAGVDTAGLGRSQGPSGVAFIQVDERGQNSIVVSPGANYALSASDLDAPAARRALERATVLLLQLEVPLNVTLAAAAAGRRAGANVVLNLAPARRLEVDELKDVSLLLVNEHEARIQLGAEAEGKGPSDWARALCDYVPSVIVTLGAEGAVWAQRDEDGGANGSARWGHVPAFPVTAVDTTAAGDAFGGALAYYLDEATREGRAAPLEEAVRFASAAGAVTTTRAGAQPALPSLAEVRALMAREARA